MSIVTKVIPALQLDGSRLLLMGSILVCIGGLGDIAYHSSPAALASSMEPLVGAEAVRTHVATLAGMLVALTGVVTRGLRR